MFVRKTLFVFLLVMAALIDGYTQKAGTSSLLEPVVPPYNSATPAHMWEMGLHAGIPLALSDVDFVPGFGAGFHIRRALDYVFSIRSSLLMATMRNEDLNDGSTKTTWQSANLEIIASLNNLVWSNTKHRTTNFYGLVGVGLNHFKVDVTNYISAEIRPKPYNIQSQGGVGLGFSYRLSDRFNISAESKAWILFGKDSDRLDAVDRQDGDVLSYSSIRLNFNIGNKEKKAEPLYWVNPMDQIQQDVTELKNRPVFDLTDTDGDGVIDLLDQDNATPKGVQVDTRGLPLDSDGDGIPNHEDARPYLPSDENGKVLSNPIATDADLEQMIDDQLDQRAIPPAQTGKGGYAPNGDPSSFTPTGNPGLANWFLPLIHFDIDSYKIRYADYGNLSGIARMLKSNPGLRLVVTGYTDKTASNDYNIYLSYKRAKAAIDHLVQVDGISRDRLILQYSGENAPLVPSARSSLMNRRVEFRVASPNDVEMPPPPSVNRKGLKRKGF